MKQSNRIARRLRKAAKREAILQLVHERHALSDCRAPGDIEQWLDEDIAHEAFRVAEYQVTPRHEVRGRKCQ